MTDCLFCRIVEGGIPAAIVAETEDAIAFRDIAPQAPTHVLVVPREHVPDVAALAERPDLLHAVVSLASTVASDLDGGWRLVFNTGADAGQTVFHAHAHVLGGALLGRLG